MKPPSNLSHLEKLIGAWGDEESDTTTARLRRLIGVSVLVGILDGLRDGDGNPRLALKGGAALELRLGHVARSSSDVDAVVNFGIDEAFTEIGVLLQTGWQGFTGTLGDRLPITRPGITPVPQRAKIKLFFRGKNYMTLPFELAWAEAGSFYAVEAIRPAIDLSPVHLDTTGSVEVLSVEYQVAQKLHACTEVPSEGQNTRVHDLYDLCVLGPLLADLVAARAAAIDTFEHRAKHSWPPRLSSWPDWPQAWQGLGVPNSARFEYAAAVKAVSALIDRIDGASL